MYIIKRLGISGLRYMPRRHIRRAIDDDYVRNAWTRKNATTMIVYRGRSSPQPTSRTLRPTSWPRIVQGEIVSRARFIQHCIRRTAATAYRSGYMVTILCVLRKNQLAGRACHHHRPTSGFSPAPPLQYRIRLVCNNTRTIL